MGCEALSSDALKKWILLSSLDVNMNYTSLRPSYNPSSVFCIPFISGNQLTSAFSYKIPVSLKNIAIQHDFKCSLMSQWRQWGSFLRRSPVARRHATAQAMEISCSSMEPPTRYRALPDCLWDLWFCFIAMCWSVDFGDASIARITSRMTPTSAQISCSAVLQKSGDPEQLVQHGLHFQLPVPPQNLNCTNMLASFWHSLQRCRSGTVSWKPWKHVSHVVRHARYCTTPGQRIE